MPTELQSWRAAWVGLPETSLWSLGGGAREMGVGHAGPVDERASAARVSDTQTFKCKQNVPTSPTYKYEWLPLASARVLVS